MSGIEVIPSARRLIRSLRDMGYDFAQAVADVVDNSVEAGATQVAIDIEFDGDESWVRIADNGKGMKPDQLREAMRFGAERDYGKEDLGKFGLGLKTASLSQCEHLSVASRWNTERADIAGYSWDLDHIAKTNKWEIIPLGRMELGASVRDPLKDRPGTVVMWRRLDRLLGYKHPYGESSRKRLLQMCREVEIHLAMVFQRFISGAASKRKLRILVNGNPIEPWDPFCRAEPKTQCLTPVVIPLVHEGVQGDVTLEPFILPPQHAFSSKAAFEAAAGPSGWNQQQGFYIYRAARMIQSGGWSNLRAPDEHMKLARVAVHFAPALDDAFKINVAKMRVQLPAAIRDQVRAAIGPVVKLAREVYDRKPPSVSALGVQAATEQRLANSATTSAAPEPFDGEPARHGRSAESPVFPVTTYSTGRSFTLEEWSERMLLASSDRDRPAIERVLARVRSKFAS